MRLFSVTAIWHIFPVVFNSSPTTRYSLRRGGSLERPGTLRYILVRIRSNFLNVSGFSLLVVNREQGTQQLRIFWASCDSGGYSPASHRGCPGSVPYQFMCCSFRQTVAGTNVAPTTSVITPTLHTHLQITVELHLSRLTGTASHLDKQKIRKVGFFFENRLHWQFEVRLLLLTICTCV